MPIVKSQLGPLLPLRACTFSEHFNGFAIFRRVASTSSHIQAAVDLSIALCMVLEPRMLLIGPSSRSQVGSFLQAREALDQ